MRKIVVRDVVPSAARSSSSRAARLVRKSWLSRERYLPTGVTVPPGTITTHHNTSIVIVPGFENVNRYTKLDGNGQTGMRRRNDTTRRPSIHAGSSHVHNTRTASRR